MLRKNWLPQWVVFPSVPAVLPLVLLLQNADAAKGCLWHRHVFGHVFDWLVAAAKFCGCRNIFQADFYGSVQLYRRGGRREYQMPCATLLKNWQESNQKNLCAIVQYVKFFCESAKAIENKGGLCYNSSYPLRTISSRGFHAVSKAKSKCRTVSMFDREDFCYEAHQDHQ